MAANLFVLNYYVIEFCFYLLFWVWWDHCLDLRSKVLNRCCLFFWFEAFLCSVSSRGAKASITRRNEGDGSGTSPQEEQQPVMFFWIVSECCSFAVELTSACEKSRDVYYLLCRMWTSPNWFPKSNNLVGFTNVYTSVFCPVFGLGDAYLFN